MKPTPPEEFRIDEVAARRLALPSQLASDASVGRNGLFYVPHGKEIIRCIISDGEGWEHVSVSLSYRCPTWAEMSFVKDLFWDAEECVIQFHPPRSEYVNNHPHCLHLWKPSDLTIPRPPSYLVGVR